ncbi:cytochrome P450 3A14-like [Ostrea edulis]|uniref:cytochrome P450 3A14-like n=1 Tax=Ostrea edulis TaxID=37623 RepID=UPI0024AF5805|nr:cytochrome P450 3A14-like [Ostrea edulis]
MDILGLAEVPGWLLTIFLLILSLYLYSKYKLSFWSRLGVPHPKPTLFLGHAKQMKDGIGEFDLKMLTKYDRVVGTYSLHRPALLILDPELTRDILIKDFFSIPSVSQATKRHSDLGHALTRLTGEKWRFTRSTISPIFSSGKMRKISPILAETCARLLQNVENETNHGHPIEFKRTFGNFTMDSIAAIGFGIHVNAYGEESNEFLANANSIFNNFIGLGAKINAFLPPLYNILFRLRVDLDGQRKTNMFFKGLVEQAANFKGDPQDRIDILQLLLNAHKDTEVSDTEEFLEYDDITNNWKKTGLSKAEVTANSIMFMVAGYETTANALTFAAYSLATHPEYQKKLIMEIDSTIEQETPDYDNIQKLEYLDCVFKETLRLYPLIQRIPRETHQEMNIAGYTIPPNTPISIPIYAFHQSPKYWEEPEVFNPDRFLEKNKSKLTPYAYLPFGLGPRTCIAKRLAYMEAKCALITILQKYKFIPCEQTQIPVELDGTFILKPKKGMVLKLEKRETQPFQ